MRPWTRAWIGLHFDRAIGSARSRPPAITVEYEGGGQNNRKPDRNEAERQSVSSARDWMDDGNLAERCGRSCTNRSQHVLDRRRDSIRKYARLVGEDRQRLCGAEQIRRAAAMEAPTEAGDGGDDIDRQGRR